MKRCGKYIHQNLSNSIWYQSFRFSQYFFPLLCSRPATRSICQTYQTQTLHSLRQPPPTLRPGPTSLGVRRTPTTAGVHSLPPLRAGARRSPLQLDRILLPIPAVQTVPLSHLHVHIWVSVRCVASRVTRPDGVLRFR